VRFYCAGGLIDVLSDGTVFAFILRVKSAEKGVNYFHCARALRVINSAITPMLSVLFAKTRAEKQTMEIINAFALTFSQF
jgi:hypothetical protein